MTRTLKDKGYVRIEDICVHCGWQLMAHGVYGVICPNEECFVLYEKCS